MARLARVVVPGTPHHIVQRGNRRQRTFFRGEDYEEYLRLMAEYCRKEGVEIWAYCLMTNHVHLIAVPKTEEGLRRAIAEAHRRYSRYINFRKGWRGFLWQGRFSSYPMDETHLLEAARYIERNPVTARLVRKSWNYPWSSAKAHLTGENDVLTEVVPLLKRVESWKHFLEETPDPKTTAAIELHQRTGRPLGELRFLKRLERDLERELIPKKAGRPKGNSRVLL